MDNYSSDYFSEFRFIFTEIVKQHIFPLRDIGTFYKYLCTMRIEYHMI